MRTQVGRVLAAVVVIGAVVSGCGTDRPGSAVVIGADAVPLEQVQAQLDTALSQTAKIASAASQGVTSADISRDIVTRLITHDIITRQAGAAGITVPDQAVDAAIASNGGVDAIVQKSFLDPTSIRQFFRDQLLATELGKRVAGTVATADIVGATSRSDAEKKAKVLAAGGAAADQLLSGSAAQKGRSFSAAGIAAGLQSAGDPTDIVLGIPVGSVVYLQPDPSQANWSVLRLTDRHAGPAPDAAALSQIEPGQLAEIGLRSTQPVLDQLGVTVNPRFGVWDPIQLRVIAADNTSGAVLAPAAR